MSILCYVTEQIQKDATTHGIGKPRVAAFAEEIEKRQSLAGFDQFPPPCLTKKKIFGFNYRLVAAEKRIGEHLVVVLLRLVVRGGNEYGSFLENPPAWAGRHFDAELDDVRLSLWVSERVKDKLPAPKPQLSAVEQTFLWEAAPSEEHDDVMICETHEWVQEVRESRIADRLVRLPMMILRALDGPDGDVQVLRSTDDRNLAIVACNLPARHQCALLSVSYGEGDDQLRNQRAVWAARLAEADSETVLRYSRRSYPSLLCCDDDMWLAVQKNHQAK
jgi:hypothetical protein